MLRDAGGAARRFEKRRNDPYKTWKLTRDDWRNRKKRPAYEEAVEEMLDRTDPPAAPWHVIAADDKRWARVDVVRTVCVRWSRRCRSVASTRTRR